MRIERSNNEWVSLVSDGDRDAINDLYDILYRHVCHFLYDTSSTQSFDLEQTAQDAAQDAVIAIQKNTSRYEFRSRFTSWACAIARNKALGNTVRKRSITSRPLSIDAMTVQQAERLYRDEDDSDSDLLIEIDYIIRNHLNERQRYALLESINGAPVKQIAYDLNTNANNIYKIIFDTKALIRDLIGQ